MSMLAPIIRQSAGEICFRVDDVGPLDLDLAVHSAAHQLAATIPARVLYCSLAQDAELIRTGHHHPLVSAVHLAFSQHRPLALTPDIIWLTIAQGFANHVRNSAEALRHRLVRHEGKRELSVLTWDISRPEHWAAAIDAWSDQLARHSDPELAALMLCDFSTTTRNARIASQIVLMDALQRYFDYDLICVCGIPTVTLTGTLADWQNIRDRVERLGDYDLRWWTDRLLVICDGLIQTAAGQPHRLFWQHIYKPRKIYGGKVVTGWLADLFPYLRHPVSRAPVIRNPILDKRRPDVFAADYSDHIKTSMDAAISFLWFRDDDDNGAPPAASIDEDGDDESILVVDDGLKPEDFPSGLSQVPFTLRRATESGVDERGMRLAAGFLGARADRSGALRPEIGWAICEPSRLESMFDRIIREHRTAPPRDRVSSGVLPQSPKEIFQMLDRFDGATLFAGTEHPWVIRPSRHYVSYSFRPSGAPDAARFIDLPDGRCLAYIHAWKHEEWWVVVGRGVLRQTMWCGIQTALPPDETVVAARGIEQFFARVFAAEGRYYFDDPAFLPDATLASLL
ncbi:MAG TPA: DUF4419 domain-containing protein [Herpetosiphonaceae bacterium]|nr:DUF4419 domain-containing protein [Herpetosiphonaceae bacterium]